MSTPTDVARVMLQCWQNQFDESVTKAAKHSSFSTFSCILLTWNYDHYLPTVWGKAFIVQAVQAYALSASLCSKPALTGGIRLRNYSGVLENGNQIELFKLIQTEYAKRISRGITLDEFAFYECAIWQ